jgi:hypothetical protein
VRAEKAVVGGSAHVPPRRPGGRRSFPYFATPPTPAFSAESVLYWVRVSRQSDLPLKVVISAIEPKLFTDVEQYQTNRGGKCLNKNDLLADAGATVEACDDHAA